MNYKISIRLVLTTLCSCVFLFEGYSQSKPNLIIIHTDEHSFRTLSCYQKLMPEEQAFVWGKGNNVETINIDKLANQGAICTSYYASSPVCTPSRASLVTGLYPQATGATKNGLHLNENVDTFAKILKKEGYATSYVGKWHLAGNEKYQFGIKDKAGFDDNTYMMTGGHNPYFYIVNGKIEGIGQKAFQKLSKEEKEKNTFYVTDFFTDKALEILDRDKSKPFCLMLSIPNPHTPDVARAPYDTMYNHMDIRAPKTMGAELAKLKPSWATQKDEDKNEAVDSDVNAMRNYFGMVKCIDDNVGRILAFLDKNNLTKNTIVVFTSDHGDMLYEHNRVNKGVPYEASAKIPFVIRYPNKIKAGKVIHTAYTNVDFAPTILGLMGVKTKTQFQGLDTSNDFTNDKKVINSNRITYFAKSGGWWVTAVNDRYKLVLDKKEKPWLIDLEKDPNELINFYYDSNYKDIAHKMQSELMVLLEKYKEPGLETQPYILK